MRTKPQLVQTNGSTSIAGSPTVSISVSRSPPAHPSWPHIGHGAWAFTLTAERRLWNSIAMGTSLPRRRSRYIRKKPQTGCGAAPIAQATGDGHDWRRGRDDAGAEEGRVRAGPRAGRGGGSHTGPERGARRGRGGERLRHR